MPAALEPVLQRVLASSPSPTLRNAASVLSHLSATISNMPVVLVAECMNTYCGYTDVSQSTCCGAITHVAAPHYCNPRNFRLGGGVQITLPTLRVQAKGETRRSKNTVFSVFFCLWRWNVTVTRLCVARPRFHSRTLAQPWATRFYDEQPCKLMRIFGCFV